MVRDRTSFNVPAALLEKLQLPEKMAQEKQQKASP